MTIILLNSRSSSIKAELFENSLSFFAYPPYQLTMASPVQNYANLPQNDPIATMRLVITEQAFYLFTGETWENICDVKDIASL